MKKLSYPNTSSRYSYLLLLFIASIFVTSCCNDDQENIPEQSDIFNLGILSQQSMNIFTYDFSSADESQTIIYSFIVEESTDYLIRTDDNVLLTLKDGEDNIIASSEKIVTNQSPYNFIESGLSLPTNQKLYLELKSTGTNNNKGNLSFILRDSQVTDLDFGLQTEPIDNSVAFSIKNEPDDRLSVVFEIEYQTTSFSFDVPETYKLTLFDASGNKIGDEKQSSISGTVLEPGKYELEILNNTPYENSQSVVNLYVYPNTDVDLGVIQPPYRETHELIIYNQEPDNKIVYTFSISDFAEYFIYTEENVELILKNRQGTIVASGSSFIGDGFRNPDLTSGDRLELENTYYLEIIDPTGNGIEGTLDITLRNVFETDIDLGILNVPSNDSYDFEIANGEPDQAMGINFEINTASKITVTGIQNLEIYLFDSNWQFIERAIGNQETIEVNLMPGQYSFDIITREVNPNISEQLQIILTND